VMEIIDVLVRLIDVTCDPFHLQDVGIQELSVKDSESNVVEIVKHKFSYLLHIQYRFY
jgi:hypothetical protein